MQNKIYILSCLQKIVSVVVWQLIQLAFCSLCIKHPNLFGGSEKLDVSWDKGLSDSNVSITYRRPRPEWLCQKCFVIQVSCYKLCLLFGAIIVFCRRKIKELGFNEETV
jgi:hypothetical protein